MRDVNLVIQALPWIVLVLLFIWATGQVRKPSGPLGQLVVGAMNQSHADLTDWGLEHVEVARSATVLDIGCGGGRTLKRLAARAAEGQVHGIDVSKASVATSRRTNAADVASGRVRVELGSVQALPYPDRTFDAITAVETHYYWPDLAASMREILRVLKPGGTFAVIAETHRGGSFGLLYGLAMPLIRAAYLTDPEHRDLLARAGFTDVATFHKRGTTWICATGRRPT